MDCIGGRLYDRSSQIGAVAVIRAGQFLECSSDPIRYTARVSRRVEFCVNGKLLGTDHWQGIETQPQNSDARGPVCYFRCGRRRVGQRGWR